MALHRRGLVTGAGAILAGTLAPGALAGEPRNGRAPITRKEWDGIVGAAGDGAVGALTCVQTTQLVEGPFYYESSPERRAIADRRPGVPLRLGITLSGLGLRGGCYPLRGAIIDVWQTDASGLYSNVGGDLQVVDTTGQSFLRGHQQTDEKGYVEFETIVPGWEIVAAAAPVVVARRTTHIHVKAFHEREVLTAQLFFPDPMIDELYRDVEPYKSHAMMTAPGLTRAYERVRNSEDNFFKINNGQPMSVERVNGVLFAKATIGVVSQGHRGFQTLFR